MHAYVFIGRDCWGFTHDADAANLPAAGGPWSFFRNAVIADGSGATMSAEEAAVCADLEARGYSVRRRHS